MAVAHDVTSRPSADTDTTTRSGDWSWTHTPVGTPRGVIVTIVQSASGSTDDVTGVTYGGTAMTRVRRDARTVTEDGAVYLYFLGASVPTGAQTVAVASGTVVKQATCTTVTAASDTEVDASNGADLGIVADPSVTVTHTGTIAFFGMAGHFSGRPAPPSPGSSGIQSGITYAFGTDFGATTGMWYYRTAPADAASSTYGYTTMAAEDHVISGVVIKETTGAATISPAGIASGEAFGTAVITTGEVTVSPTAIASGEAFGTAVVTTGGVTVSPSGIASAEAFGTPTVSIAADQTVTPTGIASAETFGTPTIQPGAVTVTPTGIASAEVLGSPTVRRQLPFTPPALNIRPTKELSTPRWQKQHMRYYQPGPVGQTLLRTGGVWSATLNPTTAEIAAATVVLHGGHDYRIDPATAAELLDAGFGGGLVGPFTHDDLTAFTHDQIDALTQSALAGV